MKLNEIANPNIEEFKQEFAKFMADKYKKNAWLAGGDNIQVYVRKAHHPIGDQMTNTLDIANINVENRGQGTGMEVINWLHEVNPFDATYVESLQNPRLYARLLKDGWIDVPNSIPPSVFLPKFQTRK